MAKGEKERKQKRKEKVARKEVTKHGKKGKEEIPVTTERQILKLGRTIDRL
jgi:hypothetical protein